MMNEALAILHSLVPYLKLAFVAYLFYAALVMLLVLAIFGFVFWQFHRIAGTIERVRVYPDLRRKRGG